MERNETIETIGSITKMEHLCSLEKDVLNNSMVLRNTDPFPGFRNHNEEYSSSKKPESIFIILRYRYAPEKINRIIKLLRENEIINCFSSFGEIITEHSILPCIRIKQLKDYSQIPTIQEFLKNNELKLMAYSKVNENGRIKIFKSFKLIEIAEDIYRDLNDKEKVYFRIPKSINWKKFDYVTEKIKHQVGNGNFDAALGVIYRFCGPEDVIRIYDKDKSLHRAMDLKKYYSKEIKKDIQISASYI